MKTDRFVFKRHELKYKLTPIQYAIILEQINKHLSLDEYGETTIQSLYYDTDTWLLIRNSIEKPVYKEKLRVRSYGLATPNQTVFLELKKKYKKIVYKRRIRIQEKDLTPFINLGIGADKGQIEKEIRYFCSFYGGLKPSVFLSYEREAFYERDGGDFRVTFDDRILCRQTDISLCSSIYGMPLLREGQILMELKCSGGIPLWMVKVLSQEKLYKTSFSKYGTAYSTTIFPKIYLSNSVEKKEILTHGCNF